MPLLSVAIGISFLLFLMIRLKVNPFLGLIFTSIFVGLINGISFFEIVTGIQNGFGNTMGKIALIIVFGAMLGKLLEESGAAHVLTDKLVKAFGLKHVQYAILITGFLVGLPMMYNASFLVMIPLVYSLAVRTGLSLLQLGIPLAATLSIAHAFLPPHPAPTYISTVFGANLNLVLLVGLGPVVPACLLAGIVLSKFFKGINPQIPVNLFDARTIPDKLPTFKQSLYVALSPIVCMLAGTILDFVVGPVPQSFGPTEYYAELFTDGNGTLLKKSMIIPFLSFIKFISDATIALLLSVIFASYFLFVRKGITFDAISRTLTKSVKGIAMILLIIGAGGSFSEVLKDAGVNTYIGEMASSVHFNPILVAFCVAAVIRFAVGSATVATMTAAPIVVPLSSYYQVSPEIMVLATGSGSLMFSHFNDVGFWMFKEYFNVNVKQTFQIWTVMECLVGLTGLAYCLILEGIIMG